MSTNQFQSDPFDSPSPRVFSLYPPLPPWLAHRLLGPDEKVTWVRGPRLNPWWERYVTHPGLFLVALAIAAGCLAAARLTAGSWSDAHPLPVLGGPALVLGSIFVLAFFNGYFTRLVVTDSRLVILQGYEVRHSWNIDTLPRSLVRYSRQEGGQTSRTIDLDALQTALGGSSTGFTDAKTIQTFGKQLNRIRARENDRPDPGPTLPGNY